jgi:hypothetical protein
MKTSTSLQALAALAIGSALLASPTPADAARGGFRSAPVRSAAVPAASFNRVLAPALTRVNRPTIQPHVAQMGGVLPGPNSVPRSNARGLFGDLGKIGGAIVNEVKTVGGDVVGGKIQNIPGDVLQTGGKVAGAVVNTGVNIFTLPPPRLPNPPQPVEPQGSQTSDASGFSPAKQSVPAAVLASQIAAQRPVFIPTATNAPAPTTTHPAGSTGAAAQNGTLFNVIAQREAAAPQAATAANMRPGSFPTRPQFGGRGGFATFAPTMSPGPAYVAPVSQPAPVAPVAMQPSASNPVQPSCLRQAITQDGQVVIFDICRNQAVGGPLAQTQTQPQTQTQ